MIACMNPWMLHGLLKVVPLAGGGPPRVLPTELKVGFAGPAFRTAFSTACASFLGSAPRIVSTTVEFRNIMKVGILWQVSGASKSEGVGKAYAETPYLREISCWLSTFTLVKVTTFGLENFEDNSSYLGAITLQGPHQSAWYHEVSIVLFEGSSRVAHVEICYNDSRRAQ